jgi:hypothetical protein
MGLNGKIPIGGHVDPSSIVGDKLLWKNVQKNEMKNTSEIINRIIPHGLFYRTNPAIKRLECAGMEKINWAAILQHVKLLIAIYFNKTNTIPVAVLFQPISHFFL